MVQQAIQCYERKHSHLQREDTYMYQTNNVCRNPQKSHPFKLQVDHFHTSRECAVHIHLFPFMQ